MNRKLIAAAVSAAVIAPVAAQAESSLYGNITNAVVFEDKDSKNAAGVKTSSSATDMSAVSSRFGIKASSDLGNGMTASGRYEFQVKSDQNDGEGISRTRVAYVGLSGGFGSVTLGQQWSSFYNTVGSMVSPNYSVNVGLGSPFRTANTVQYTNSFGPVSMSLDVRVDDDEPTADDADGNATSAAVDGQGSGTALGLTINPMENLRVGIAFDSTDSTKDSKGDIDGVASDLVGIAAKMSFGNFWGSIGYQKQEFDEVDSGDVSSKATDRLVGNVALKDGLAGLDLDNHNDIDIESEYLQLWLGTNLGENTTLAVGFGTSEHTGSALDLGDNGIVGGGSDDADTAEKASSETDYFAVAFNHKLGGGTHLFAEYTDSSTEGSAGTDKTEADNDKLLVGIRLNF